MLFKNQKAVVSVLHHLLDVDNFVITGSFADHIHLKNENVLINDIDILIEDEKVLEKLNPYFTINKINDVKEDTIPYIKKVFIYYIMNVKVEIFLVDKFKDVDEISYLNLPFKVMSEIGRRKGLINFIELAKSNQDSKRILKHSRKLKKYVSNRF